MSRSDARHPGGRWGWGAAGALMAVALAGLLGACGGDGGGSDEPAYALTISGGEAQTATTPEAFLSGTGFLPAGSTCPGGCTGLLPPPVFGILEPYELGWRNADTGGSGAIRLAWICNCGGSAPAWSTFVPVQPGANRITVTMRAGGQEQQAGVVVTRQ